jgi:hypothetical protein
VILFSENTDSPIQHSLPYSFTPAKVKTLPESEVKSLLKILTSYYVHITTAVKEPSRLMRVFGLFKFYNHRVNKSVYMFVANNFAYAGPGLELARVYDLKGRKTKHKVVNAVICCIGHHSIRSVVYGIAKRECENNPN